MKNRKNIKGFADHFKELLNLTDSQIEEIRKAEFQFHKNHFWNSTPKDFNFETAYKNTFLKYLTDDQIIRLKKYQEEQKIKEEKRQKESFNRSLDFQTKRLKDLNLTTDQLQSYVRKKMSLNELRKEKILMSKSEEELDRSSIERKLYEDEIYPIFNPSQLNKYKALVNTEKIKKDEKSLKLNVQYKLDLFKQAYSINLTKNQAHELCTKDFDSMTKDSNGEYYSEFEMWEKEKQWLQTILSPDQFQTYLPHHEKKLQRMVDSLTVENDTHDKTQLDRLRKYQTYYIQNVLPHMVNARKRLDSQLNSDQKERRAKVGLGPIEDYIQNWGMTWDLEKHKARTEKMEMEKKE